MKLKSNLIRFHKENTYSGEIRDSQSMGEYSVLLRRDAVSRGKLVSKCPPAFIFWVQTPQED
jgi:hypothetical protein